MKTNNKTKYLIQIIFLMLVFGVFVSPSQASEITPNNIIKYVNLARESQGLSALVINPKLMQVAKDKLDDMIANQYFAHTSPSGVSPWVWFQKEDYNYHYAGENLAINFVTAESEQSAWMASPTHRKNILDSNYQEIGVAVGTEMINGQSSIIAVQEFGATFAGIPNGEKTFSPLNNSKLQTNDGQIIPQVLSAKNVTPSQPTIIGGGGQGGILDWFKNNKLDIIDQGFSIALIILMFSIALAAVAFLMVAIDSLRVIIEADKEKRKKLTTV